jgi:hypothetical protein
MSVPAEGWEGALAAWARSRDDIEALVQIGSRVQPSGAPDAWSDYDYHLVTSNRARYETGEFARELGGCWAVSAAPAFGRVTKVAAVYDGALEADFVIVGLLEARLAFLAMRWPGSRGLWPRALRSGVDALRIVASPGWRVVKGGAAWEGRYAAMPPLGIELGEAEFRTLCSEFWVQAVWAVKRAERGEWIAGQRAFHLHLLEAALRVFQEESRLAGRSSRPQGRRAEGWLRPELSAALSRGTRPERGALIGAAVSLASEFRRSSSAVAAARGWAPPDVGAAGEWIACRSDAVPG